MTVTTTTNNKKLSTTLESIWRFIKHIPPVYPIFFILYIIVASLSATYASMDGVMSFMRRTAPLGLLAVGEMLVLATGGYDLSIGSIVTLVCLVSSLLLDNNPANTYPTIGFLVLLSAGIGLLNGVIVSFLKVPSFIATLGMMLIVRGVARYWVGGAPKGYFTDNFRMWGRGFIENVPVFGRFPIGLILLIVIGGIIWYIFHRTNFGKRILAIGDNVRAARLSGIKVNLVRIGAFVLSATLAAIAGVMIGGTGGVNVTVGDGLEMSAIAACVIGGVVLGGGKGSVINVIFGAYTLQILFSMLNLLGLPKPYKDTVQGALIIAAVAYVALSSRKKK